MKRITIALYGLSVVLLTATVSATTPQSIEVTRNLTSMPIAFTENQGQWDEQVQFRANAGVATMWFTKDGAVYQFTRSIPKDEPGLDDPIDPMNQLRDHEPDSIESITIKASFVGANPNLSIEPYRPKCGLRHRGSPGGNYWWCATDTRHES